MASFKVFPISSRLPENYQLASKEDVEADHAAVMCAMPEFEAAELSNGWVDGTKYGSKIGTKQRTDLVKRLGIKRDSSSTHTSVIPAPSTIYHLRTTGASTSHPGLPEQLQEILVGPSNGGGITVNYYNGLVYVVSNNDLERQEKKQPSHTYSAPGDSQFRVTYIAND